MTHNLHPSEEAAIKELLEKYKDVGTAEIKKQIKELRRAASLREIVRTQDEE